jgi:hypothetical protein
MTVPQQYAAQSSMGFPPFALTWTMTQLWVTLALLVVTCLENGLGGSISMVILHNHKWIANNGEMSNILGQNGNADQ